MQACEAGVRGAIDGPSRRLQASPRRQQPCRRRVAAPAACQRQQAGKGFGKASKPAGPDPVAVPLPEQQPGSASERALPPAAPASGGGVTGVDGAPAAALPAVSRGRIFAVCAQVSFLVTTLAVCLRQVAPAISPAVADGRGVTVESLLRWATLPSASQLALAVAVAAGVTGARVALLAVWPDFKEASDSSNKQVLGPLGPLDLVWVGALPAVSEELLFRGALIPAAYPDWRGVLIAGLAFGVLHNSGGRNPAFAAWASLVGCAYGALFLATGTAICPVVAHSLSNIASGALWKAANGDGGGSSSSGKEGSKGA